MKFNEAIENVLGNYVNKFKQNVFFDSHLHKEIQCTKFILNLQLKLFSFRWFGYNYLCD